MCIRDRQRSLPPFPRTAPRAPWLLEIQALTTATRPDGRAHRHCQECLFGRPHAWQGFCTPPTHRHLDGAGPQPVGAGPVATLSQGRVPSQGGLNAAAESFPPHYKGRDAYRCGRYSPHPALDSAEPMLNQDLSILSISRPYPFSRFRPFGTGSM